MTRPTGAILACLSLFVVVLFESRSLSSRGALRPIPAIGGETKHSPRCAFSLPLVAAPRPRTNLCKVRLDKRKRTLEHRRPSPRPSPATRLDALRSEHVEDGEDKLTLYAGSSRVRLASFVTAFAAFASGGMRAASAASPSDDNYADWFALPLAPYAKRKSLLNEVVPGEVWTVDQIFGTFYVHVPIRSTILRVDGGLLVYAPVAATPACVSLVQNLADMYGPVKWILLPSKAVEHKALAGPFSKRFPAAEIYVAPGQFSVPVNLPLTTLGFPPNYKVITASQVKSLPWAKDCDTALLDAASFAEVALFHRRSKTLLLTDSLVALSDEPPPLLLDKEYSRALVYHARDEDGALPDVAEVRRRGWQRIALFATFFNPGALRDGDVDVPETRGDLFSPGKRVWQWQSGWETSFRRLRNEGRPFVVPIIRELILKQQPEITKAYVNEIASWDFDRVVPAHFDCPLAISPAEFRSAFAFLDDPSSGPNWCAEDLSFLSDLQKSAVPEGSGVAVRSACGYGPRS